ncbi:DUF1501 domain-containing protein [Aquimarina sp. ERC-38]|uniref:DUF1501 domain-containing protein n=1 Tax=Aquimarina sp. ERC-38 TaxID=2949996 RepID=UPI00224511C8|nr:DUF1501 domain-containing protein [Aquimarina sp. ERC-38]UZO81933.1 DUF1501 domain-containing protein [Aquimarina sp. ERC-38]
MTTKKQNTHVADSCNHEEHKQWNRRSFLQALGIVGGGTMALANSALSVAKPSPLAAAINTADNDRILVLIRLKGGNDGLNTIVPLYDYDTYSNARPTLRIKENELFKFNDDFGMAKYANKLERMWGDGMMKVVHGVGYENSSLSHFKGSDIWATTDPKSENEEGWMGRYFEQIFPDYLTNPPKKPTAIQIGNAGNLIFDTADSNYAFAVADPKKLYQIARNGELYDMTKIPDCTHGEKISYIKGVANATFAYAGVINDAFDKSSDFGNYSKDKLGQQLSIIARLIKGNLGTKVYMVELGGFDTHNDQLNRHETLITTLSETIANFYNDLKDAGWDDKVLSMTISEFGRRVEENGSAGTDHGTASQTMLFGSGLDGNGFIGKHPDLSDLNKNGNLKPNTDFRSMYATVLKEWLCVDPKLIDTALLGANYDILSLGFSCNKTLGSNTDFISTDIFEHKVTYIDRQTYLNINLQNTMHVDIRLFNMLGQKVATLQNKILTGGKHVINVKSKVGLRLDEGQYIYKIKIGQRVFSKPLMIL